MPQQKIKATELERRYIARRITEANVSEEIAKEVFTMFCEAHGVPGATFLSIDGEHVVVVVPDAQAGGEAHGIPGATFVGIDGDSVIVAVPEPAPKPELVKEA